MRAVVLREGKLEVRDTPDPAPGPGELLLRTLSTAICASDVHFIDHPDLGTDDPTGRSCYDPDRDTVLGHEFVGEVIGHGPDTDTIRFPLGVRVTSMPLRLVDGGAGGVRIIGGSGRTSPSTRPHATPSTCGATCGPNAPCGVRPSSSNASARLGCSRTSWRPPT